MYASETSSLSESDLSEGEKDSENCAISVFDLDRVNSVPESGNSHNGDVKFGGINVNKIQEDSDEEEDSDVVNSFMVGEGLNH